ncbi:hypothetical protein QUF58_06420 [Anaerolineales bacterium HSG24]|nr:hypothetical protein [Anaerolineales bacterium HSG24]MDM8531765.1 hypothetical protein [Anaerolineales bacterium HSG25]
MKKRLSFSKIKFDELCQVVPLKPVTDHAKFDEWFHYDYTVSEEEVDFLANLIDLHRPFLGSYSEEELKVKYLTPVINKVNFMFGQVKDWYERPLKTVINDIEIGGYVDFMVAKGIKEPQRPYFFIQEFKKSKSEVDPEDQLLAELLVAMTLNQVTMMRGAYIMGKVWSFVILEKQPTDQYIYYVSKNFDNSWLNDLKQIYINLQAVKYLYCQD